VQIKVENPSLPALGWAPGKDNYPLDLAGDQRYARPSLLMSPWPYPPIIGGVAATGPLYDIWVFTGGRASVGNSFNVDGRSTRELGNTGPGIGAHPSLLTKLLG